MNCRPSPKTACVICGEAVKKKTGILCHGPCKTWAHFKCLNYSDCVIKDIKKGIRKVMCPCPDCEDDLKPKLVKPCCSRTNRNETECNLQIPPPSKKKSPKEKNKSAEQGKGKKKKGKKNKNSSKSDDDLSGGGGGGDDVGSVDEKEEPEKTKGKKKKQKTKTKTRDPSPSDKEKVSKKKKKIKGSSSSGTVEDSSSGVDKKQKIKGKKAAKKGSGSNQSDDDDEDTKKKQSKKEKKNQKKTKDSSSSSEDSDDERAKNEKKRKKKDKQKANKKNLERNSNEDEYSDSSEEKGEKKGKKKVKKKKDKKDVKSSSSSSLSDDSKDSKKEKKLKKKEKKQPKDTTDQPNEDAATQLLDENEKKSKGKGKSTKKGPKSDATKSPEGRSRFKKDMILDCTCCHCPRSREFVKREDVINKSAVDMCETLREKNKKKKAKRKKESDDDDDEYEKENTTLQDMRQYIKRVRDRRKQQQSEKTNKNKETLRKSRGTLLIYKEPQQEDVAFNRNEEIKRLRQPQSINSMRQEDEKLLRKKIRTRVKQEIKTRKKKAGTIDKDDDGIETGYCSSDSGCLSTLGTLIKGRRDDIIKSNCSQFDSLKHSKGTEVQTTITNCHHENCKDFKPIDRLNLTQIHINPSETHSCIIPLPKSVDLAVQKANLGTDKNNKNCKNLSSEKAAILSTSRSDHCRNVKDQELLVRLSITESQYVVQNKSRPKKTGNSLSCSDISQLMSYVTSATPMQQHKIQDINEKLLLLQLLKMCRTMGQISNQLKTIIVSMDESSLK